MSYRAINNAGITPQEAQALDRQGGPEFHSDHHKGKVGLGSKLHATLPTEVEKDAFAKIPPHLIPGLSGQGAKVLKAKAGEDGYEWGGPLPDGAFAGQTLEWDGSAFAPYGFLENWPGAGGIEALNPRWTPPSLSAPGSSLVVGANQCAITSGTSGSDEIMQFSIPTLPIQLAWYWELNTASSTGELSARLKDGSVDARLMTYLKKTGASSYQCESSRRLVSGWSSTTTFSLGSTNGCWNSVVCTRTHMANHVSTDPPGTIPTNWKLLAVYEMDDDFASFLFQFIVNNTGAQQTMTLHPVQFGRPHI